MIDMVHTNPWVVGVVERMVGGPLRAAERTRGVYALFPQSDHAKAEALGPHHDTCNSQVIVMLLVDDVAPSSGGFTVWPTSHVAMYRAHTDEWHWSATADNQATFDAQVAAIQPAEIVGKAGDVCFMHGRMIHSGGVHKNPDMVRLAMFADFQQARPSFQHPEGNCHPNNGLPQW